jgi:hypothetical protein
MDTWGMEMRMRRIQDLQKVEKGFTFFEVILALVLFMFGILAITRMFGYSAQALKAGGDRTRATLLAQEKLEILKDLPYGDLSTAMIEGEPGREENPDVHDQQGSIRWTWTIQKDQPVPGLAVLTVKATWTEADQRIKTVTLVTLRLAPVEE